MNKGAAATKKNKLMGKNFKSGLVPVLVGTSIGDGDLATRG